MPRRRKDGRRERERGKEENNFPLICYRFSGRRSYKPLSSRPHSSVEGLSVCLTVADSNILRDDSGARTAKLLDNKITQYAK